MGRHALLIAAGQYEDATLGRLRAPAQDVDRFAAVLEDPEVGGFDSVQVLTDVPDHLLRQAIEDATAGRHHDDLLLIYFSCHGIVDRAGRLYFATSNTRVDRPASTAISTSFLNEQMESCLASGKVLVLDCCYSGAFAEGFKGGEGAALDGRIGKGYVVLSASDRYEFALEGDGVAEAHPRASVFTDVMLEGLSTGAADLDANGLIDTFELFRYVYDGVTRRKAGQTPRSWSNDSGPNIYLAKASRGSEGLAQAVATGQAKVVNNYRRNQVVVARGMSTATELVRRTLGPLGQRTIFVNHETGDHVEVADAGSVAEQFQPDDPLDRLGARYVGQLITDVYSQAGGCAATAVVLAQAMVDAAAAALRNGATPIALSRGLRAGTATAVEALAELAKPIQDQQELAVAVQISAQDAAITELVLGAFAAVGPVGSITVEESNSLEMELEHVQGLRFGGGHLSPYFITDESRLEAVLEDPLLLLLDDRLETVGPLVPLLEEIMKTGKPLLLVAVDVVGESLATLVVNKVRDTFKSIAVKVPGAGDTERRAMLEDLAILSGGRVVDDASTLAGVPIEWLGNARRVVVTPDATTIIDGGGSHDALMAWIAQIDRGTAGASMREREATAERLTALAGGVAVIKVGALSDKALKTRVTQVERVISYARLTIAEGVVPGGGVALATMADRVRTNEAGPRAAGVNVVAQALRSPMAQLLANAEISVQPAAGLGVDVVTEEIGDPAALGILDAAGALRVALENAALTAERFLLTS